jgi:hypothetical protein
MTTPPRVTLRAPEAPSPITNKNWVRSPKIAGPEQRAHG